MEFVLSNCGIIQETRIECNGITLITGKNGSGKSTLVKCIVSLFSTLNSFEDNISEDVKRFIYNRLYPLYSEVFSLFISRYSMFYYENGREYLRDRNGDYELLDKFPLGLKIFQNRLAFDNWHDSVDFLNNLLFEFENNLFLLKEKVSRRKEEIRNSRIFPRFEQILILIPNTIKDLINYLSSGDLLENYVFESIKSLINYTFSNQLVPFSNPNAVPKIIIKSDNNYFSYEHNTKLSFNDLYNSDSFSCFYIDDGNIIDQIDSRRIKKTSGKENLLQPSFFSLKDRLLQVLSIRPDVLSRLESFEKNKRILDLLNGVWPHSVSKRGGITINDDNGSVISNEASGAKVFIILKLLLERNKLNENTLLIFDEPENHLHPEWQNKFAEIITNISKETGTRVICITHSPSLLLAFDVYSNILEFRDKFKCYFGDRSNLSAYFKDVSLKIEEAHDKLNEPYVWMDLQDK